AASRPRTGRLSRRAADRSWPPTATCIRRCSTSSRRSARRVLPGGHRVLSRRRTDTCERRFSAHFLAPLLLPHEVKELAMLRSTRLSVRVGAACVVALLVVGVLESPSASAQQRLNFYVGQFFPRGHQDNAGF